jgi:hypothetical protein
MKTRYTVVLSMIAGASMTRTVTTALVLTFLLAINAPSFAQQTGPATTFRTHPALQRLLNNSKDGEPTVPLKGYVIQSRQKR